MFRGKEDNVKAQPLYPGWTEQGSLGMMWP